MEKEDLLKAIEDVEITYDYEETYSKIYNLVIDYMNYVGSFDLEDLFSEFVNYYEAEEYVKNEIDVGGLARLACCIDGVQFYENDLFRIDVYGNLYNVTKEDLENLKEEIIDYLKD